jgi:phosphatidate cytidylyltransferase
VNNFLTRSLTGALFVIVMIASILYGPMSMQLLFLVLACTALYEFYKLVEGEVQPQMIPGIITAAIVYIYIAELVTSDTGFVRVLYAAVVVLFIIELFRKRRKPFSNIAYTLLGIIYIVVPFALLVQMSFTSGVFSYVLPFGFFILLWTSDTFAYLAGMALGKHKLFERISPKKTWEGSIGGGLACMIAAYILFKTMGMFSFSEWLVMAIIIVIAGTFGDLAESMLKRSLEKKDSGTILPGHGGLLDRFDGLFLAVPFLALYLWLIRG